MHDVLIVGLPMLMILAGILMNRSDVKDLRSEIKDLRQEGNVRHSEVLSRFNVLKADMRQFYHLTGKLEARMDAMESVSAGTEDAGDGGGARGRNGL